jgi:putative GTP pyrophosphokinase
MEREVIEIDWEKIGQISYHSNLGKSLKNTLRKFDKEALIDEIQEVIKCFNAIDLDSEVPYENRVKALQSCILKYNKYYPSKPVEQAFNDLLGFRVIIKDYSIFDEIQVPENVKIADMRNGKANDDGYRGIHLYFQKSHFHYPIEFQFVTGHDKLFNQWLHDNTYKYIADSTIGHKLRVLYEQGIITCEEDFRKEMQRLCVI